MAAKLTDAFIKSLAPPPSGNKIHYDTDVRGFGVRITANGSISYILNYRTELGRERRITIGSYPAWKTVAARAEASELKRRVDRGEDPLGELQGRRAAPTVNDLCDRYEAEVLPKRRPATASTYKGMLRNYVRPQLGKEKVADIKFSDIDALHRKVTSGGAPYAANRVVALLSKLFNLAVKWEMRTDTPVRGIERNSETKRRRYLTPEEIGRLTAALATHNDQQAANIVKCLLLTGARRNEVQSMRWADLDLTKGVWSKPGATTKQRTDHIVPLSAPARQLLATLRHQAEQRAAKAKQDVGEFVFPGKGVPHRTEIKSDWRALCLAAGLYRERTEKDADGKTRSVREPNARVHDLRHTYASVLASAGLSLPVIGALLGHSQAATTARYAHLLDDPLRSATERVAAVVMGSGKSAEVVPLKGGA
jgi:integrase